MRNKISVAISALSIGLMSSYALAEIPSNTENETRTETVNKKENHVKKITIDAEAFIERIVDDIVNSQDLQSMNSEDFQKRHISFIDEKINLGLTDEQKVKLINLMNQQNESVSPNMPNSLDIVLKESEEFEREMKKILNEEQVEKIESIHALEITLFDNTFEVNRDGQLVINGNVMSINQEEIEKMTEQEAQAYFEKIVSYVDVEAMKVGFNKFAEKIMTHMQEQMEIQMQKHQEMQAQQENQ
jgi:hypothetical protein